MCEHNLPPYFLLLIIIQIHRVELQSCSLQRIRVGVSEFSLRNTESNLFGYSQVFLFHFE